MSYSEVYSYKREELNTTTNNQYLMLSTLLILFQFSYAYIVPPTRAKAGLVEVRRNFLSSDED